jgi:WD40 repeat protein
VHPTLPYLLSCSDDMLIKLWDWDKNFTCTMTFEGHVHYVMQVPLVSPALSTICLSQRPRVPAGS